MRPLDLDLLKTMLTVAEEGTLSAASVRLSRSQSAVSEQVQKLEEFCGTALFSRGREGARLTGAGQRLLGHAEKMLAMSDAALQDMQEPRLKGDLRIAITDYFRPTAIPQILSRIRQLFPDLRLHVSIAKSAAIEQEPALVFDLGVSMRVLERNGSRQVAKRDGRRISLRREPVLWVGTSFSLPEKDTPLPLLGLPHTCSLQRFVIGRLEQKRIAFYHAHTASGVAGLRLALRAGLGISYLNLSSIPEDVQDLSRALPNLPRLPDIEFELILPSASKLDVRTLEDVFRPQFAE